MVTNCTVRRKRFFRCKISKSLNDLNLIQFVCRQTMVLVFYLLCIVTMMFLRPCLNRIFLKKGKSAVYCSLYFIPVLSLFHTVAGGLICEYLPVKSIVEMIQKVYFSDYSFPYLSVIISMISNAVHFSLKLDQSMKALILSSVKEMKNTVVICKLLSDQYTNNLRFFLNFSWSLVASSIWNHFATSTLSILSICSIPCNILHFNR